MFYEEADSQEAEAVEYGGEVSDRSADASTDSAQTAAIADADPAKSEDSSQEPITPKRVHAAPAPVKRPAPRQKVAPSPPPHVARVEVLTESRATMVMDRQHLIQAPPDENGVVWDFRNVVISADGNIEFYGLPPSEQKALKESSEGYTADYKFFPYTGIFDEWTRRPLASRLVFKPLTELKPCTGSERSFSSNETVFMMAPWHLDNAWHTHNDNVLPLYANALLSGALDPATRSRTVLLVMFLEHLSPKIQGLFDFFKALAFDELIAHKSVFAASTRTCIARFRYGRGPLINYIRTSSMRARVGPDPDAPWSEVNLNDIVVRFSQRAWAAAGVSEEAMLRLPAAKKGKGKAEPALTVMVASRAGGSRAFTANGDVLIGQKLADLGAVIITPDWNIPLLEQIRLFAKADVFVGASGAAMIMSLYIKRGAVVVEGRAEGVCVPWFHSEMAQHRRLRYLGIYLSAYDAAVGMPGGGGVQAHVNDLANDVVRILDLAFGIWDPSVRAEIAATQMSNEELGMPMFFASMPPGSKGGKPAAAAKFWGIPDLKVPSDATAYIGLFQAHLLANCHKRELEFTRYTDENELRAMELRLPMEAQHPKAAHVRGLLPLFAS